MAAGSVANSIITIARKKLKTHLFTQLADDLAGRRYLKTLDHYGVEHFGEVLQAIEAIYTNRCIPLISEAENGKIDRTLLSLKSLGMGVKPDDIKEGPIKDSHWIFV